MRGVLRFLKLEGWLQGISANLASGFSVGIISIPLAIAFAIASGVRPEQGLYTALVAGLVASLLGGCRFQITGPASTFAVLLFSITGTYGYAGVVITAVLAGLILIIMGAARFGVLIKFIPYPVVLGFTTGIAVVLAVGQLPDFLGLPYQTAPKVFLAKCQVILEQLYTYNPFALAIGGATILLVAIFDRYFKRIPGTLAAILCTALLALLLKIPVETIGDRFGAVTVGLPNFRLPQFEWGVMFELFPTAFALSLVIGIESLLSAMVADGMTGTRHNSNRELIGQGVANIASVLFGGIPATGSLTRTVMNVRNGAMSRLSAVFVSSFMALTLLLLSRFVAYIPLASLAAVLLVVAYKISDWRHFTRLFRSPVRDISVLLTTFVLTVFVNLISALEIGIILATLLFVDHSSKSVKTEFLRNARKSKEDEEPSQPLSEEIPFEIEVFDLSGPLFFAAVDNFKRALNSINSTPQVLIIRLRHVTSIDASGIHALEDILVNLRKRKTLLFLSGPSRSVLETLFRTGFAQVLGAQYIFKTFDDAFLAAKRACGLLEVPSLEVEEPVER